MNIKVLRMWSGEDVIANILAEDDDFLTIINPLVAVPAPDNQISFAPWAPFLKDKEQEVKVQKAYVVYVSETLETLEKYHKEMFSVIETPKSGLIL